MSNVFYIWLSGLVGILTGFVTIHSPLAHSWTSMIFWVIVGLIILYFSNERRIATYAGADFGFLTIFTWLFSGFQGASNQLPGFLTLTLILSIIGALCGVLGSYAFYALFRRGK